MVDVVGAFAVSVGYPVAVAGVSTVGRITVEAVGVFDVHLANLCQPVTCVVECLADLAEFLCRVGGGGCGGSGKRGSDLVEHGWSSACVVMWLMAPRRAAALAVGLVMAAGW